MGENLVLFLNGSPAEMQALMADVPGIFISIHIPREKELRKVMFGERAGPFSITVSDV